MSRRVKKAARDLIDLAAALEAAKAGRYDVHHADHETENRLRGHWQGLATGLIRRIEKGNRADRALPDFEPLSWSLSVVIARRQKLIYEQARRDSAANAIEQLVTREGKAKLALSVAERELDRGRKTLERALAADGQYQSLLQSREAAFADEIELGDRLAEWRLCYERLDGALTQDRIFAEIHKRRREDEPRAGAPALSAYYRLVARLSGYDKAWQSLLFSTAMIDFLLRSQEHQQAARGKINAQIRSRYRAVPEARRYRDIRLAHRDALREHGRLSRELSVAREAFEAHSTSITSAKEGVDAGTQVIAERLRAQYENEGDHSVMALAEITGMDNDRDFVRVMRMIQSELAHIDHQATKSTREIDQLAEGLERQSREFLRLKSRTTGSASDRDVTKATVIAAGIGGIDFTGFAA